MPNEKNGDPTKEGRHVGLDFYDLLIEALKTTQCIMKKRPASEGRGCDGRRLRCAALCRGFAPLRRR